MMKKLFSLVLVAALMLTLFAGCSKVPAKPSFEEGATMEAEQTTKRIESDGTVRIAGLVGPTGIGMSYLFKSIDEGKSLNKYAYTIESDPSLVGQKLLSGELDIAALPTNVAATLYNKSEGKIKIISLATLNVLYLVEMGEGSESLADLKGSKIYISGQGSAPEYVMQFLLEKNGLKVGTDVNFSFEFGTHADLAALVASNRVMHCVLPEPNATISTSKASKEKITLDLGKEWEKAVEGTEAEGSEICMGCIAVNSAFLDARPKAVSAFLREYKASVSNVRSQTTAPEVVAGYKIVESADVAKEIIPRCNIVCITGDEMQEKTTGFLKVLFDSNKASVGGKLPDDNFYYKDK